MKTYTNLYTLLCSTNNLYLAYLKARKHKTKKEYVIDFERDLQNNLNKLQTELITQTYKPRELTTFIVRDPKTRRINASHFRDRIVHHALCNIIQPIFEPRFIQDSFANQKNKGTHKAILRYEKFLRKVPNGYALKCDIKSYFDNVDHKILLDIIKRKIADKKVIWLIETILSNHKNNVKGKGMPLGNLTSQFFANVYLNELDYFVKHKLHVKHYIRYVDDFVLLSNSRKELESYKIEIDNFLKSNLSISLHPDKSRIIDVQRGVTLLGFRIFLKYRLLKKSNQRRIWKRIDKLLSKDKDKVQLSMEGWFAYAKFANTYNLRTEIANYIEPNKT